MNKSRRLSGLTILKTRHNQVYQNFVDDPFVNDIDGALRGSVKKLKEIFFEEVDNLVDDATFVSNAYAIAAPYVKMGPKNVLTGGEVGGTAMPLKDFIYNLKTEINKHLDANPHIGVGSINDRDLESAFLNAGLRKDFKALDVLVQDLELENVSLKRSDRIMWCYINEKNSADIFDGIDRPQLTKLPCILGLDPASFAERYICFGHKLDLSIFIPTAMDAGMFEYWRPGKKTHPLPDCSTYTGKYEFVHNPNTIKSLTRQIEVFNTAI